MKLNAQTPYRIENGLLPVADGTFVEIRCSAGSEYLTWLSSSGITIPKTAAVRTGFNVRQSYDPINRFWILYIVSFSPVHIAHYTCRTDYVPHSKMTVYISSGKLRWSEPKMFVCLAHKAR